MLLPIFNQQRYLFFQRPIVFVGENVKDLTSKYTLFQRWSTVPIERKHMMAHEVAAMEHAARGGLI
jgi:hypothetical protein